MARFVDLEPLLNEKLPAHLRNMKIQWGPIGKPIYDRTYSHEKESGKKETWPETVVRAVDGNLALVGLQHIEEGEREKLYELLLTMRGLPAGRHLNASGMKGRQFLFNCHGSGWDFDIPEDHFTFLFDALMMGGGVGSNYSNRYMEKMPKFETGIDLHIVCRENHPNIAEFFDLLCPVSKGDDSCHEKTILVPDSREGWVESVDHILKAAWTDSKTLSRERRLVIDVSGIRPRGEPLKTSGGIACGPGPLVKMLSNLTRHVNGCFDKKLTSLDAMTLDHSLADCVVAGGKRRSSRMSTKNWQDDDIFAFINCKKKDGEHWTTNISVEVDDAFQVAYAEGDQHAKAVMRAVVVGKRTNGEPGLWNIDLARQGEREPEKMFCPNPCGEIGLHMWENCNLGHINLEGFVGKPRSEMLEGFRLMSRWLVRATFGDIPNARQRAVVDRNRRIGVGFLGYHGWLALNGKKYSESWQDESVQKLMTLAHQTVIKGATEYAVELGIPTPTKFTTLAPTGSTSLLPGVSSSAQTIVFPWFKRRVRYADNDPELAIKKLEGYPIYPDEDAQNTTIVEYWCEDPLVSKVRAAGWDVSHIEGQGDVALDDYLEVQAMLQDLYADNAISFTVPLYDNKMPTEEEMEASIARTLPRLKGTTMYPDRSRKNSPYESLTREEFESYTGRKEIVQIEVECKGACPVK
jgi:ribonucleoside-triphosphate reductase